LWGYLYSLREKLSALRLSRSVISELTSPVISRGELSENFANPLAHSQQHASIEDELRIAWRTNESEGKEQCGYHRIYAPLLAQIRATPNTRILEIGIYRGGSHRAWRDLTTDTEVLGIDIDPATLIEEERITSTVGDQIRLESLESAVKKLGGSFDLVIDDGWHQPEAGLKSLQLLLPRLRPDGWYVLEDIAAQKYGQLWRRFVRKLPRPFVAQILTGAELPELVEVGYELLIIRRMSDTTPVG